MVNQTIHCMPCFVLRFPGCVSVLSTHKPCEELAPQVDVSPFRNGVSR